MSHPAIIALGKEKQIARPEDIVPAFQLRPRPALLPGVAWQGDSVQREDRLHQSRAVRSPGSDATPHVGRSGKKPAGRFYDRLTSRNERAAPLL